MTSLLVWGEVHIYPVLILIPAYSLLHLSCPCSFPYLALAAATTLSLLAPILSTLSCPYSTLPLLLRLSYPAPFLFLPLQLPLPHLLSLSFLPCSTLSSLPHTAVVSLAAFSLCHFTDIWCPIVLSV